MGRSKLQSVLEERCPRCHTGKLFISSPYHLKYFDIMHENCPHCGLHLDIEPGFYTGAMYVSYAFSVAIFAITGTVLYFVFNDPRIGIYIFTTFFVVLILFPLSIRYSRVVYLHLFSGVKYDPHYSK